MQTRRITKDDYDQIVEVIDRWWGGPMSTFALPIFFYELGENALIVEQDGRMVGFLLGFLVFKQPKTGYVHLVGIHPDYRRKGVARLLYQNFTERCRTLGCHQMKAITTPGNEGSLKFHEAMGWRAEEIDDYAGPSRKRVVFTMDLVPPAVGMA